MAKAKDLSGQIFGRLTVCARDFTKESKKAMWLCICECGSSTLVRSDLLLSGKTKSCGCFRVSKNEKHGMKNHPFYETWMNMHRRARRRGISVNFIDIVDAYNYLTSIGWESGLAVCRGTKDDPDKGNYERGNIYIDTRGNNTRDYFNISRKREK